MVAPLLWQFGEGSDSNSGSAGLTRNLRQE